MLSLTKENYPNTIYHLSKGGEKAVQTYAIAELISTTPATATNMIKRFSSRKLITYEKYCGANITRKGQAHALMVIRKHRLWEAFPAMLNFSWGEVHEVAEQLEHIQSPVLIEKLDEFLGHPATDPHGHSIIDTAGTPKAQALFPLAECPLGKKSQGRSAKDDSATMLQYLSKVGIQIGSRIEKDGIRWANREHGDRRVKTFISKEVSENILITT